MGTRKPAKFLLGAIYMTPGVSELPNNPVKLQHLLHRHVSGDWGDMDAQDCATNDQALARNDGERLFSSYDYNGTKIWIITDRPATGNITTCLKPDEY